MDDSSFVETSSDHPLIPKNEPFDLGIVKTEPSDDETFVTTGILETSDKNEFSVKKEFDDLHYATSSSKVC